MHGNRNATLLVLFEQFLWQTTGFRSENKGVIRFVINIQIAFFSFGAAIEDTITRERSVEFIHAFMYRQGQILPIIQPGTFQGFVGKEEPAGEDDVQISSGAHAKPANIAGIGWNLWLEENYIESRFRQLDQDQIPARSRNSSSQRLIQADRLAAGSYLDKRSFSE